MTHHHVAATLALAVLPAWGLPGPGTAGKTTTFFKGKLAGVQTEILFDCPLRSVQTSGTCRADRFGHFTLAASHVVNVSTCTAVGCYEFSAADGDTISAHFQGESSPTPFRNIVAIKETATIIGGTGRFAGASGSFVVERYFNKVTAATTGAFNGFISCSNGDILGERR